MENLTYLKDVVTLKLDQEKCNGCGVCLVVCPHAVFAMDNGLAAVANRDACMECGACAMNCASEAIMVESGVGCAQAIISETLGGPCDCC